MACLVPLLICTRRTLTREQAFHVAKRGEMPRRTRMACTCGWLSPLRPGQREHLAVLVSLTPCRYPRPYPNSTADKTQPEESSQKKVISPTSGPQLRAEAILVGPQQPSAVRTEIKASEFPADAGEILRGPKHQVISALVSLPEGAALGIVCDRRFGAMPLNMGNPTPSPMVQERCAKRGADSTFPRRSRRQDFGPERSHPIANSPIGHASGGGASRGRSRHAPALGTAQRQARPGWAWGETVPPAQTPLVPPRLRMQELLRAYEPLAVFGDGGLDCGGDL
jgi:hypothetical protein